VAEQGLAGRSLGRQGLPASLKRSIGAPGAQKLRESIRATLTRALGTKHPPDMRFP